MKPNERRMREDRAMRDAARALVRTDIARLRVELAPANLMGRIGDGVQDVLDEAKDVADDNRGVVRTLIAALLLWFAREPLLSMFHSDDGDEWDEEWDDRRGAYDRGEPPEHYERRSHSRNES